MNAKRERFPIKKSRLENEVILAVVVLYVLLSAALLLVHHVQPDDVETQTSSTSPAHSHFSAQGGTATPTAVIPQAEPGTGTATAQALLAQAGYRDVHDLHCQGTACRAAARKDGEPWQIELDVDRKLLVAQPAAQP